jgi:diguanylate cyclase (GGDEF)-like protein
MGNKDIIGGKTFLLPDVFDIVLDHIDQGIVVVGPSYRTLAFNQHFVKMLQIPMGAISVGVDFRDVLKSVALVTRQNQFSLERAIVQLDEKTPFTHEFVRTIGGVVCCFSLVHKPLPGNGFVRTITDITTRKTLEANQLKLATSDPVTGLSNQKAMVALVKGEMKRVKRHQRPFSILMICVDHLKQIFDQIGPVAGDELLALIAKECNASMVRENDRLGRWGDSEFMLILLETDQVNAMLIAKRMRKKMAEMKVVSEDGESLFPLAVNIGVTTVTIEDAERDVETVIDRASKAMFSAKTLDRNHVVYK